MSRIFVEEDEANNHEADNGTTINLEQLKIHKTYTEALNQFLEPNQKQPRAISEIFRKKKPKPPQEEEAHQKDSQELPKEQQQQQEQQPQQQQMDEEKQET